MVGLAQLVVDALGTGRIPTVRDQVAKIIEFAQILRAGVVAAEHGASFTEGGVLMPDGEIINAVRSYGLGQLPLITHILQELCGQGLAMRFSKSNFDHQEIGPDIERYMGNTSISAREKSRLMNAVWDYTLDSHGGRSALFENVNALAGFTLRGRLYSEFDRAGIVAKVADFIGFEGN
jgi:4-hydroxyphenylacetate 3-monooxygenase